jgi:hypothetical protein
LTLSTGMQNDSRQKKINKIITQVQPLPTYMAFGLSEIDVEHRQMRGTCNIGPNGVAVEVNDALVKTTVLQIPQQSFGRWLS